MTQSWTTALPSLDDACIQVPALVEISKQALQDGQCVVIGLQTTGEARTAELVSEQGSELDDFVSGPKVRPSHYGGFLQPSRLPVNALTI